MKWLLKILFFLLQVANLTRLSAQNNLHFEHFTSENGLSENFVYTTYQDKKGFLWIGTHDGLNRYDGYNFKKFRHEPSDSNSLPDNTIYSITEDGQGNIWIGTNAGLSKYDAGTGMFYTINLEKKLKAVQQVVNFNEEELLIWHDRSLCLINTRTQKEITINYNDSNGLHSIRYSRTPIVKDRQENIYIARFKHGDVNILKYDKENKWFIDFITVPVPEKFANGMPLSFYIDSRNQCWLATGDEETYIFSCQALRSQKNKLQPLYVFSTKAVRQIFEDNEGNIWLASNTGLFYYDRSDNQTHWYKQKIENAASISSNDVQGIFQDRTGILWIATSNGLNKINPFQKKIRHLTRKPNIKEGLYNNFVSGIFPEGTDQLRIHYNVYEKNHFTRYYLPNKSFKHFENARYDPTDYIKEIGVKNPEKLTPGLMQVIVDFYEKKYDTSLVENSIGNIWIDRLQQIWSNEGDILTCLNTEKNRLVDTGIVYMELYDNDLWIASTKGLVQFNTATKTSVIYNTLTKSSNSISSNDITCFLFEQNEDMWIGTKGGGLNFFDRKKNKFYQFTDKDGLCNSSIYCMVKDDKGRLWLGTSFGLSNFDPATRHFQNFFKSDGLINNEYNRYSACKMPDGTVFMGGMNGIDFFHPDSLLVNESKPVIEITDFKLFNQSIYPGKISSLRHDQNFITIEFAAMDFNNPAANKFSYKLEGADKDWVMLEGRNFAAYSHLRPGSYRFLVKAANSRGVWNNEPKVFQFTIMPAWYRTWWFYSLCAIAIASIAYILFRYSLQQKLRVLQVRNRLHRDLHDDVGATLSSVKAYSEILGKNGNSEIISGLIKENAAEMIDRLEVISWATNPHYDNFKSLTDAMMKFARPVTHAHGIELQFEKQGIEDNMMMPGDIRQNILLIFKEAVNNMVKYAEATECYTKLMIRNQRLILEIKDNGKGYDGIIKGGGAGIKNMQKRAKEMNGKLEMETARGKGTVIRLIIPHPFKIPSTWYPKKPAN